jgi:ribosomal protein S12 methylthiotransferase
MIDRTVHIVSLGCQKNKVDAEVMAAILADRNFQITPEPQAAEVILINTCAFILPAKEEAIDEILRMARYKKTGALKYLVVTGCLPQRYGRALEKEIPEVDLFLGISEVPNIIRHISNLASGPAMRYRSIVSKPDFLMNADHSRLLPPPTATTYLKIADATLIGPTVSSPPFAERRAAGIPMISFGKQQGWPKKASRRSS